MKMKRYACSAVLVAVSLASSVPALAAGERSVVVSTSMLASAMREIIPKGEKVNVVTILPPSSCPGHYDLSPRVVPRLKSASLSIIHDFQGDIEKKLKGMGAGSVSFRKVSIKGSPLVPSNYHLLAQQVASMYESVFPGVHDRILISLDSVKSRTDAFSKKAVETAKPWKGRPVIAATHTVEFCVWLGFDVVGIIRRTEEMKPRDYQKIAGLKADMIVANLQEGTQGAESLSERMKIPCAVLSNFPGADGFGTDYYDLMNANLSRLAAAWDKR